MAKVTPQAPTGANGSATALAPAPTPQPPPKSKPLPAVPDKNCGIDTALAWWSEAAALHPSRLIAYLYRLHPVTKTKPAYCAVYPDPMTYQQLLMEKGAGEYKLHINDKDKGKFGEVIITRWKTKEHWTEYPPVLDPGTLDLDNKDNRSYVEWLRSRGAAPMTPTGTDPATAQIAKTMTDAFTQMLARQMNNQGHQSMEAQGFKASLDLITTTMQKQVEAILSQAKKDDPTKFTEFVQAVQTLYPQKGKSDGPDPMMTLVMAELSALRQQNTALITKILEQKAAPKDELSQTIMAKLLEHALDNLGGKGGPELKGWPGLLMGFKEEIGEVAGGLGALFRKQATFGNRFTQQQPPPQQTAAAGIPAAEVQQPPPPQPHAGTAGAPPMDPQIRKLGMFFLKIWDPMCNFIKQGRSALDFGDYIAEGHGFNLADADLLRSMGHEKLVAIMTKEGLEAALANEGITMQRFSDFLKELLTWEPAPPGGDAPAGEPAGKVM